jgi:hypothetical protein
MSDSLTPIERAARALALKQSGVDEWDALDEAFQQQLIETARAVIDAYEGEYVAIPRMD